MVSALEGYSVNGCGVQGLQVLALEEKPTWGPEVYKPYLNWVLSSPRVRENIDDHPKVPPSTLFSPKPKA